MAASDAQPHYPEYGCMVGDIGFQGNEGVPSGMMTLPLIVVDDCIPGSYPAAGEPWTVSVPVTRIPLRHCKEVVGEFNGMYERDNEVHVIVHDRLIAFPAVSAEAAVLGDALAGVPLGTRVGVLCLVLDGRRRIFVRTC